MDLVYPREHSLFRIALTLAVIVWIVLIVGTVGIAMLYVGIFFLFAIFAQAGFISYLQGSGVRVTGEQYPDLHTALVAACNRVGLTEVPEMYLLRTDFFNALATRFLRRHYVVLFTDVVDALSDRPEAINFYIGHELGHIHRNHIRWGWVLMPVTWLPVLGSAYRRAEEYTCDRYGNACCATEEDATAAVAAIVAGDTRWKSINVTAYLKQVEGPGGFWMSLNEFISDYPWLSKRMAWIVAIRRGETPEFPQRSFLAGFLSMFVPSIPGGFVTLISLIFIFGILAAVALPAYQDYIENSERARMAEGIPDDGSQSSQGEGDVPGMDDYTASLTAENLVKVHDELVTLQSGMTAYYDANGTWPSDFTALGWSTETLFSEHGGMPTSIFQEGTVAMYFGNTAAGEEVYFFAQPVVDANNAVAWRCAGQNIAPELLPATCQ